MTHEVRVPFVVENLRSDQLHFWLIKHREDGGVRYKVFANERYTHSEGVYIALLIPLGTAEMRVHEIDNCEELGYPDLAGKGIGPAIFRHAMTEHSKTVVSSSVKFAPHSTGERRSQKAENFWRRLHANDLSWYRESDDRWIFSSHAQPCPKCPASGSDVSDDDGHRA